MSNKKFFIFALASFLALALATGPALAAATPPAIADTYEIDGVTYYNVNSQNFDSSKKFYEDVFNAKHSALGGRSLAELWTLAAVGVGKGADYIPLLYGVDKDEILDAAKEAALKGYGTGYVQKKFYNYQYTFTAPKWNNSGYVEATLNVRVVSGTSGCNFRVIFSDFGVGVLLPGNKNHYVSTVSENDTSKGEEPSSSARNDSGIAATLTQNVSKTITASLASTINHSFSYGFQEGIKVGAGFTAGIFQVAGEVSFSANQTISDGWSKTDTKTDSKTISNTISVTLPPYTTAMMKQGEADTTITTKYNCPVFLSYKVSIYYESGGAVEQPFGPNAREDLQKRALVDVDYDPYKINWKTVLADKDYKDAIEKIASHVPMSSTGATMEYTNRTVYSEVSGIAPLYPLSYVKLGWPNLSFIQGNKDMAVAKMTVGEYSYTNYLPLEGCNDRGAAYYGFNSSYGGWRVVDEAGNELTGDSAPVVLEKTSAGYSKYTAMRPGKCFLRYFIDENAYPSGLGSNSYTKNSDLSGTAQLEIDVAGEKVDYQIDGEYNGIVNSEAESIEGDGKLEVHAYNADDIEVDAPYSWEKRELKGITMTSDGTVSFTKPGTFHVRVRNTADKTVYSAWKAITAIVTGDDYVEEDIPLIRSEFADGDTQFVITGRFLGGANISESIEGEGKFQVETHTHNGQETAVQYTWEADSSDKGITITEDGTVSFDNPGVYHVRLRSTKAAGAEAGIADAESGTVASEWLAVWVNEKAPARLLQAPTASDYYNAKTPELVTDDARYEGGVRILYGLASDDVTPPTGYSTAIPTATGAGTYYVWCKVQGDENHTDSSPVCVTATLEGSGESGSTDTPTSNRSGGGCDAGFAGIALLALAGLAALLKFRR